jgi:hypothetical protein
MLAVGRLMLPLSRSACLPLSAQSGEQAAIADAKTKDGWIIRDTSDRVNRVGSQFPMLAAVESGPEREA